MGYKVVKFFRDLQDGRHEYHVGDDFPRAGITVSEKRIAELSSTNNLRNTVLIVLATTSAEDSEQVSSVEASYTSEEEKAEEPKTESKPRSVRKKASEGSKTTKPRKRKAAEK